MLITKKDFVKYGCKLIDNRFYVNIGGKWYKLKKSKYAMNYSPIHVNDRMTGKMHDMCACSTSCACNKFCMARRKLEGYICNKCYAEATVEKGRYGKQLSELLETNFELLNSTVLPIELLPRFPNLSISRIEAFGDVASVICAINYANIAKVNPNVTFGWWSKNLNFLKQAFDAIGGKPQNIVVVQSSPIINQPAVKHPIADKVFTVYTKEYATEHNIEINCGARSCVECQSCYKHDTETYINELLKN